MKGIVDIRYGYFFPWPFRLIAALCMIAAVALAYKNFFVAGIIVVGAAWVITAVEGTSINPENKTYQEYTSFLFFFRVGMHETYSAIEKIFVNSTMVSQRLYTAHTSHSSKFSRKAYHGFLKLSDGKKIKLLTKSSKEPLMRALGPAAHILHVVLEDQTGN